MSLQIQRLRFLSLRLLPRSSRASWVQTLEKLCRSPSLLLLDIRVLHREGLGHSWTMLDLLLMVFLCLSMSFCELSVGIFSLTIAFWCSGLTHSSYRINLNSSSHPNWCAGADGCDRSCHDTNIAPHDAYEWYCMLPRFPCPVSCCRFEDIRHKMESILYHSTIFRIFILVMIVRNFPFLRLLRFRFKFPGPWGSYFSGFVNSDCASKPWPQHPAQAQPDISLRGLRARNLMELADVATFMWCELWQLGQELVPEFLSKLLLSHCG